MLYAGGGAGEQYVAGQQGEDFGGCGNLFGYGVVHFGGVAFLHDVAVDPGGDVQ